MLAPFAFVGLVVLVGCLVRWSLTGHLLSPWALAALEPAHVHPLAALAFLRDFFVTSGAGMLIVFPLWYLVRGSLSGLGTRALVLTLAWCALATLGGDGPQPLPFSQFMVPILAVLLVAVQEAMTHALDSRRPWLPRVTWVLFLLGLVVSMLASKFPGDLGSLPTYGPHRAWMAARAPRPLGQSERLGRDSLLEEIKSTGQLRELGLFLRDNLDPQLSVLTPWPGLIGYLSSLRVIDALSRVTPLPGTERLQPWGSLGSWDLLAVLEERPDYIVPGQGPRPEPPTMAEIVELWSQGLDRAPGAEGRRARLAELLGQYELITVPNAPEGAASADGQRFLLMRRLDLGAQPELSATLEEGELVVHVRHGAHQQLVDLLVEVTADDGSLWSLRPTGELAPDASVRARSSILLFPTGSRTIELLRTPLPDSVNARRVRAVLLNPGSEGAGAPVCPEVTLTP